MTTEEDFIRAIHQDRDNPVPRLVYADWLEEKGDPRCEYLRLQCRMEELQKGIDPTWLWEVRTSRFQYADLRLNSGREVSLRRLRQFNVYEGLLLGHPNTEWNQRMIQQIVEAERNRAGGGEPYLIEPEEIQLEDLPELEVEDLSELQLNRQRAVIPTIGCIGRFHSFQPARNADDDFSMLVVIWFQDYMALPFGDDVLPKLLAIDWEKNAHDDQW